MPPKSKAESKSDAKAAPPSTASRKSSRLAGSAAPDSKLEEGTKKRGASAPKSANTANKKAKTTSTKPQPKSRSSKDTKTNGETIPEEQDGETKEEEDKKAEEEKKEEAPKDAKADTDGEKVLEKGDKLPSITLQDNEGTDVDVSKLADGGKGVISFLYPKADTPGCTTQACGYRDAHQELADLGYDVYGLSKDKPAAQAKWITKKELNYKLLCDPSSQLIKKLGAFVHPNNTKRSHFIFSKDDGKLIDAQLSVKPADDPSNCVKFIKNHHK